MEIIALKCPSCNANLKVDGELEKCFCQYCGAQIVIRDQLVLQAKVRLQEMEHEERMQKNVLNYKREVSQQEYNLKKQQMKEERRAAGKDNRDMLLFSLLIIMIPMIILGVYLFSNKKENEEISAITAKITAEIEAGNYSTAERLIEEGKAKFDSLGQEQIWFSMHDSLEIAKYGSVQIDYFQVPMSAKNAKNKSYHDVRKAFISTGFRNVTTIAGDKPGLFHNEYTVQSITIDGEDNFDAIVIYPETAKIIIFYYSN